MMKPSMRLISKRSRKKVASMMMESPLKLTKRQSLSLLTRSSSTPSKAAHQIFISSPMRKPTE